MVCYGLYQTQLFLLKHFHLPRYSICTHLLGLAFRYRFTNHKYSRFCFKNYYLMFYA